MTTKRTVSLTDQGYDYARKLVDEGRFASLSAVLQHGLHMIQRADEEHAARIAAIRSDLEERAKGPFLTHDEMTERLQKWRAERDSAGQDAAE